MIRRTIRSADRCRWFSIDLSNVLPNGMLPVHLELVLHPRFGAKSPLPASGDFRLIGFGSRSRPIIPERDMVTRQAIIDRILFMLFHIWRR